MMFAQMVSLCTGWFDKHQSCVGTQIENHLLFRMSYIISSGQNTANCTGQFSFQFFLLFIYIYLNIIVQVTNNKKVACIINAKQTPLYRKLHHINDYILSGLFHLLST